MLKSTGTLLLWQDFFSKHRSSYVLHLVVVINMCRKWRDGSYE